METKAILATFYIILGIYSMIVYLRYGYKKYEVLTVADILVSLLIIVGWPLPLLQFNNILSILIETPIPCTDVPKLGRKEDSVVLTKLKNMQIVAQESLIHYLGLLREQRQMKLQKNQNLIV